MRPLVDLVGERDKEHERRQENVAKVPRANLFRRPDNRRVHCAAHWQQGQETVVTIGLNKVVSGDGQWVDVVLSERPNESLQDREAELKDEHESIIYI